MTDDNPGLPVPPERSLDAGTRARLRAELLREIDADPAPASWRRWLVPGAVAAAVLLIAFVGTLLVGGGSGDDGSAPPVAGGPSSAATRAHGSTGAPESASTVSSPATSPQGDDCDPGTVSPGGSAYGDEEREYRHLLRDVQAYRDLLAQHLDPTGEHLDARASNVQSGASSCGVNALGTKVGWSEAGQDGLGMVQVEVGRDWSSSQVHLSHEGWRPADIALPGVVEAWVTDYAGGVAVAVTRSDGLTVAIAADDLFGNNATVGVAGFPFATRDLLETAADPALTLP